MPESKDAVSDIVPSDGCESQPGIVSTLPLWHKPEISRIAIAATAKLGIKFATTDDFVS
jgi:hypothetical protein